MSLILNNKEQKTDLVNKVRVTIIQIQCMRRRGRRWVDFKINDYMFTNIFFSCDAIHYNILKKYLHVVKMQITQCFISK